MWRSRSFVVFLVVLGGAAAFVWLTGRGLPELVASHFGASGAANGFMPRAAYLRFMLVLVVVPPAAVVVLPALLLNRSNARINLPHREYWLASDRRAETITFLREQMANQGTLLAAFLAYVHGLVVCANAAVPPGLPGLPAPWFVGGLVVFVAAQVGWTGWLLRHFYRVPR